MKYLLISLLFLSACGTTPVYKACTPVEVNHLTYVKLDEQLTKKEPPVVLPKTKMGNKETLSVLFETKSKLDLEESKLDKIDALQPKNNKEETK